MPDAAGPQMREMNEISDESGAKLLGNKGTRTVDERLDDPADDVLEEGIRIVFAQAGAAVRVRKCLSLIMHMHIHTYPG